MRNRRLIGFSTATMSIVSFGVAAQSILSALHVWRSDHSTMLMIDQMLTGVPMIILGALLAKLAYRMLFWERYLASVRRGMGIGPIPR